MQILTKGTDLDGFFRIVAEGPERLLILDYDGTLAPFRVERSEALPYPGIAPLIESIMEADRSRVVIVSGRAVDDLKELLRFDPMPELYGSHGWERMGADGTSTSLPIGDTKLRGLEEALAFIEAEGLSSYSETKHGSIAFHWRGRGSGEIESLKDRLQKGWLGIAEQYGLRLLSFDGGIELRVPGNDKGTAIRHLLDQTLPGSAVAYLGDDMTDEDAFRELEGRGIRILVAPSLRPTAADLWIIPPDELIGFLNRWADTCRR
jgi:trehalose 6-phosphate phosphatase